MNFSTIQHFLFWGKYFYSKTMSLLQLKFFVMVLQLFQSIQSCQQHLVYSTCRFLSFHHTTYIEIKKYLQCFTLLTLFLSFSSQVNTNWHLNILVLQCHLILDILGRFKKRYTEQDCTYKLT